VRYSLNGKDGTLALGTYPDVPIEEAEQARDEARALLRKGIDPMDDRKAKRVAAIAAGDRTFRSVAELWFAKNKRDWSAIHDQKSREAFERDVYPVIGALPIGVVTPEIVGVMIERILARDVVDTTKKILQHVTAVFRYAEAKGWLAGENPAAAAHELIPKRQGVAKRPALLDLDALREVLRRADIAPVSPAVRLASRLTAFSACRLGNVVAAEWKEFDLNADVPKWTIPRSKMKVQRDRTHDHIVFLGPSIASDLRAWKQRIGGGYVFPSPHGKAKLPYLSRETVEKFYRETLGLANTHSLHGWRSAFSTLAKEAKRQNGTRLFEDDAVELALDHIHASAVIRAYDRGQRLEDRIALALWWDAQLNPPPVDVIPIAAARSA
jgi:integrase